MIYPNSGISNPSGVLGPDFVNSDGSLVHATVDLSGPTNSALDHKETYQNDMVSAIKATSLYKTAFSVFSQDSKYGQKFLNLLQGILDSVVNPESNWFDEIGWSDSANNAWNETYQKAITEINKLLSEYYEFINELPESQLQQFNDAGYNVGVTGEGLTPSSMDYSSKADNTIADTKSDALPFIDSMINGLSSLGSFLISGGTGIASVITSYLDLQDRMKSSVVSRQMGLESVRKSLENSGISFAQFSSDLAQHGIQLVHSTDWNNLDFNEIYGSDHFRTLKGDKLYNFQRMIDTKYPYLHARGLTLIDPRNDAQQLLWSDNEFNKGLVQYGQFQYDMWILNDVISSCQSYVDGSLDLQYSALERELSYRLGLGSKTLQGLNITAQNLINRKLDLEGNLLEQNVEQGTVNSYIKSLQRHYIDQLHNDAQNGDGIALLMLQNILNNANVPYPTRTDSNRTSIPMLFEESTQSTKLDNGLRVNR